MLSGPVVAAGFHTYIGPVFDTGQLGASSSGSATAKSAGDRSQGGTAAAAAGAGSRSGGAVKASAVKFPAPGARRRTAGAGRNESALTGWPGGSAGAQGGCSCGAVCRRPQHQAGHPGLGRGIAGPASSRRLVAAEAGHPAGPGPDVRPPGRRVERASRNPVSGRRVVPLPPCVPGPARPARAWPRPRGRPVWRPAPGGAP